MKRELLTNGIVERVIVPVAMADETDSQLCRDLAFVKVPLEGHKMSNTNSVSRQLVVPVLAALI